MSAGGRRAEAKQPGRNRGIPDRGTDARYPYRGRGRGSIARFDAAGALRVGPESAGADPGPICYGRGVLPTVTDANLILGRLQPNRFLGGEFALDLERTRRIMSEWLKKSGSNLKPEAVRCGSGAGGERDDGEGDSGGIDRTRI